MMRADCLIIPSCSCCSGKEVLITIPPLICIHQQMFSGNFTCSVSLPPSKVGAAGNKKIVTRKLYNKVSTSDRFLCVHNFKVVYLEVRGLATSL